MRQKSLGLIETYGLVAAVEAADAAVKSANVTLVGYELAKGSGMTTVKLEGDVGAVNAAVSAAHAAASKIGKVASVRVIPRPAAGIEVLLRNENTVGYAENAAAAEAKQEEKSTKALGAPVETALTDPAAKTAEAPAAKPEEPKPEEPKAEDDKPEGKKPKNPKKGDK